MKISLTVVGDGCLAPGSQQNSSVTLLDSSPLFASDDLCQAEDKTLNAGVKSSKSFQMGRRRRRRDWSKCHTCSTCQQVECRVSRGCQQIALYLVKAFL